MANICDHCLTLIVASDDVAISAGTLGLKATTRSDGAFHFHKRCASVLEFKRQKKATAESRLRKKAEAKEKYFDPNEPAELFESA